MGSIATWFSKRVLCRGVVADMKAIGFGSTCERTCCFEGSVLNIVPLK